MSTHRKSEVAKWEKDGRWHFTVRYFPSRYDRIRYPTSYPEGDDGPFFVWHPVSYDTREQAENARAEIESA